MRYLPTTALSHWPRACFLALSGLVLAAMGAGLYATLHAPVLPCRIETVRRTLQITWVADSLRGDLLRAFSDEPLALGSMALTPDDFMRFPEYRSAYEERRWWERQGELFQVLHTNTAVTLRVRGSDAAERSVELPIRTMDRITVARHCGLPYMTVLIYWSFALLVHRRRASLADQICSCLFLSVALYIACATPVADRNVALPPLLFSWLVKGVYVGAAGLITLVHLSWVFPDRIAFARRIPWIPSVLYAYLAATVGLYLFGRIGFGATFPFLVCWSSLMIACFIYSSLREKDLLIRGMLLLSTLAPILLGIVFIFLAVLPGVMRTWGIPFSTLALFSSVMPFSLTFATVAYNMHRNEQQLDDRLQMERQSISHELHDHVCNDLTSMRYLVESALRLPSVEDESRRDILQRVHAMALTSYSRIRTFVWAMDPANVTWGELADMLRRHAECMLSEEVLAWSATVAPAYHRQLIRPNLRYQVFSIFKEALSNVLKHAGATRVTATLRVDEAGLVLSVRDNGCGFLPDAATTSTVGLRSMRARADLLGATLHLLSRTGGGTEVTLVMQPQQLAPMAPTTPVRSHAVGS